MNNLLQGETNSKYHVTYTRLPQHRHGNQQANGSPDTVIHMSSLETNGLGKSPRSLESRPDIATRYNCLLNSTETEARRSAEGRREHRQL